MRTKVGANQSQCCQSTASCTLFEDFSKELISVVASCDYDCSGEVLTLYADDVATHRKLLKRSSICELRRLSEKYFIMIRVYRNERTHPFVV